MSAWPRPFSGVPGAVLVCALSRVGLSPAGSLPREGMYANVELGFSLLATFGAAYSLADLAVGMYRPCDVLIFACSPGS